MQPPKTMKLRRLLTGEEIEAVQAKKKARVDTQHKNVQARRAINTENLRELAKRNHFKLFELSGDETLFTVEVCRTIF